MAVKQKILKKILTSASALAVAATSSMTMADDLVRVTTANAATASTGAGFNQDANDANLALAAGDYIIFNVAGDFNKDNALEVGAHKVNENVNYNLNESASLGSFIAATGKSATLEIANAKVATLTGKAASENTIKGKAVDGVEVAFTSNPGEYSGLGAVNLNGATSGLDIAKLQDANGSVLAVTVPEVVGAANASEGLVKVKEGAHGVFNKLVGSGQAVASITADKDSVLELKAGANVGTGHLNVGEDATVKVWGALDAGANHVVATVANKGKLWTAENSTITAANLGDSAGNALEKVIVGAGETTFTVDQVTAKELVLEAETSKATLNKAMTVTGNITTLNDGNGAVKLEQNVTLKGNVGAADKKLAEIDLNSKNLTITGVNDAELNAKMVKTAADNSTIEIKVDTFALNAQVGAEDAKLAAFTLDAGNTANGALTMTVKEGAKLYSKMLDLAKTNINNVLNLENGALISAEIQTSNDIMGEINVNSGAAATIDGDIIANANAGEKVKKLTVKEGATLTFGGKKLVVNDTAGNKLNLDKNATLVFSSYAGADANAVHKIEVEAEIVMVDDLEGPAIKTLLPEGKTLHGNGVYVVFNQPVGDTTADSKKTLALLDIKSGHNAHFKGNAAIEKIDMGDKNVTIKLSNGASEYLIKEVVHDDSKGTFIFAENTTLKAGTVLGSSEKKILKFTTVAGSDKELVLENGVNIFAKDSIDGVSKLTVAGTSTIDAPLGGEANGAAMTNALTMSKDAMATFKQDVYLKGGASAISIGEGAKAVFEGEIKGEAANTAVTVGKGAELNVHKTVLAKTITGSADSTLNVDFSDNADFDAKVVTVNKVTLSGKAVPTFKQDFQAETVEFGANATDAKFEGAVTSAVGDIDFVTVSSATTPNQNIYFIGQNVNVGNVGSENAMFGKLSMAPDGVTEKTLTVKGSVHANLVTSEDSKNHLVLAATNAYVKSVGTENGKFNTVSINETGSIGPIWANGDVSVAANKEASFKGDVTAGSITLNDDAKALVEDGASLKVAVLPANTGESELEIKGATTLEVDLGSAAKILKSVTLNGEADKVAKVKSTINANNINFAAQTLELTGDVSLHATTETHFNGTTINVGAHTLTLASGNVKNTGDNTLKVDLNYDSGQAVNGKIIFAAGNSQLSNEAGLTSLKLVISDNSQSLPGSVAREFDVITSEDTNDTDHLLSLFNNGKFTVEDGRSGFVKYSVTDQNKIRQENNVTAKLKSLELPDTYAKAFGADVKSDAATFINEVSKLTTDDEQKAALNSLRPSVAPEIANKEVTKSVANIIRTRVATLTPTPKGKSAPAAGDRDSLAGAWAMAMYKWSKQTQFDQVDGYEMTSKGIIGGFDGQISDSTLVGISGAYVSSEIDHKDTKLGDKTDVVSKMINFYTAKAVTENIFVRGNAGYAAGHFTATENRKVGVKKVVKSEHDHSALYVEGVAGWNLPVASFTLTPQLGVNYTRHVEGGHTQKESSSNMEIQQDAYNQFELVLGAEILGKDFTISDKLDVTPHAHVHGYYNLLDDAADIRTKAKLAGMTADLEFTKQNSEKWAGSFGVGLTGHVNNMDVSLNYDGNCAKKYLGHSLSLVLKINF